MKKIMPCTLSLKTVVLIHCLAPVLGPVVTGRHSGMLAKLLVEI